MTDAGHLIALTLAVGAIWWVFNWTLAIADTLLEADRSFVWSEDTTVQERWRHRVRYGYKTTTWQDVRFVTLRIAYVTVLVMVLTHVALLAAVGLVEVWV